MHSNAVNGIGHALTCMAGRGTGRLSKYLIISGRGSLAVQVLPHAAFPDEQEVPLSVVRPVPACPKETDAQLHTDQREGDAYP